MFTLLFAFAWTVAAALMDSDLHGQPARRGTVTIGASGDVLIHTKVIRAAREHEVEGGFRHVFRGLWPVVAPDDVAFVNLETPLSMRIDPRTGDPPVLGAPLHVATELAAAGVDVVSVANNHAYDQGAVGLAETLTRLSNAGVAATGGGPDAELAPGPVVIRRNGYRVAVVSFTERVNGGPGAPPPTPRAARFDRELASRVLARARRRADIVVFSIHWSHDYVEEPSARQRRLATWLVEQGADLIVGHGPHVLQRVERLPSPRGQAACAYSLGNLISNQGLTYRVGRPVPQDVHPAAVLPTVRDGAWLRTRFRVDAGRVLIEEIRAVPLWTQNNHLARARGRERRLDIRIAPLTDARPEIQTERRPEIARALGPEVTLVQ